MFKNFRLFPKFNWLLVDFKLTKAFIVVLNKIAISNPSTSNFYINCFSIIKKKWRKGQ